MSRIYIVESTTAAGAPVQHLVEADSKAQAQNHVARKLITSVEVAPQGRLVELVQAGKRVEKATKTEEVTS